jgi:hypothetical protein
MKKTISLYLIIMLLFGNALFSQESMSKEVSLKLINGTLAVKMEEKYIDGIA